MFEDFGGEYLLVDKLKKVSGDYQVYEINDCLFLFPLYAIDPQNERFIGQKYCFAASNFTPLSRGRTDNAVAAFGNYVFWKVQQELVDATSHEIYYNVVPYK